MHFEFLGEWKVVIAGILRYSGISIKFRTSNHQRLGSAGDNDRRSKRLCSIAVLGVSFA